MVEIEEFIAIEIQTSGQVQGSAHYLAGSGVQVPQRPLRQECCCWLGSAVASRSNLNE